MRFAEKSFEVRFCAALTAAAMPFNRNPQWFGLTQAQERKWGIDTMVRHRGRLLVFQFKAKKKITEKLLFEEFQWQCLQNVSMRHANSVFYVVPEAATTLAANSVDCILHHSWLCPPSVIGGLFEKGAATTTLSLDALSSKLRKHGSSKDGDVKRLCDVLGCYCPSSGHAQLKRLKDGIAPFFLFDGSWSDASRVIVMPEGKPFGIPVGDTVNAEGSEPIMSSDQFETMLGEQAGGQLPPGLFGLFLPDPRK